MLEENGYRIQAVFFTNDPLTPENAIKVSRTQLKMQIDAKAVALRPYEQFEQYENLSAEEISADTLRAVKKIIAEVLGCDESTVGDEMHFIFDLGGTSLDYCTLLIRLQDEFGVEFNFDGHSCANAKEFAQYIIKNHLRG